MTAPPASPSSATRAFSFARVLLDVLQQQVEGPVVAVALVTGTDALTIKRGVTHPLYLAFNWTETVVLTLGVGLLIALEGTAHSLLWILYFSTVLHGARAALYRRFNPVMFSISPLVIASLFLMQRESSAALLSLGLGVAALYLHRLFLAAADREIALGLERDRLRQLVATLALVEERERIARDLHDGFGASLNAALWQARHGDSCERRGRTSPDGMPR